MAQTQDATLLREAVAAAKSGNKAEARQLLRQASVHNANNELVWLWRASLSESPKEAIFYLGEVLRINPHNQKAIAWLEKCRHASGSRPEIRSAGAPSAEPSAAATQTVTNIPAPGVTGNGLSGNGLRTEPPPAGTPNPGLARAAESVGTSTVRPEPAPPLAAPPPAPSLYTPRTSDPSSAPAKPPEMAFRARPAAVPPAAAPGVAPGRGSAAPALQMQPAPRWRCPFCGHGADSVLRRCPSCRAITVLEDLKEIEKNEGVQERVVREALEKLETIPASQRTHEHNTMLALGHLNLREATAALPYLKAASQQKKGDWAVLGVLDQLQWRKVILVVDDSLTIRKALAAILEKNDYRVVTAEDGSHALNRLNEAVPDLVLLDITMPWMDGYEVCKNIKAKALTRKVPVIMLSGKDGLFDKVRGKLAGCNDYVTKPFDPDSLLKTIKKYIS